MYHLPSISDIRANARKYGEAVSAYDVLKCVAVVLMTVDHIGYLFDPANVWWRSVGRWCVPIWFFLVGYGRTFTIPPVLYWLAGAMILVDAAVGEPVLPTNILVTIMSARLFVRYMSTRDKDVFMAVIACMVCMVMVLLTMPLMEYGSQVWMYALAGYYVRTMPESRLATVTMLMATVFFCLMQILTFGLTGLYALTMVIGVTVISIGLLSFYRYDRQILPSTPILSPVMRYVGRNTHYYYAIHFILFLLIAQCVLPSL